VALVIRAGWANLPSDAGWVALYGTSILTGIGFTMSLFIGTLAFGESRYEAMMRLGVLLGSALSGIIGAIVLGFATRGSNQSGCRDHASHSENNSGGLSREAAQMRH